VPPDRLGADRLLIEVLAAQLILTNALVAHGGEVIPMGVREDCWSSAASGGPPVILVCPPRDGRYCAVWSAEI